MVRKREQDLGTWDLGTLRPETRDSSQILKLGPGTLLKLGRLYPPQNLKR